MCKKKKSGVITSLYVYMNIYIRGLYYNNAIGLLGHLSMHWFMFSCCRPSLPGPFLPLPEACGTVWGCCDQSVGPGIGLVEPHAVKKAWVDRHTKIM